MPRERRVQVDVGDGGEPVVLLLRGVPRARFDDLLSAHPAAGDRGSGLWDIDGLAAPLLAEVIVDPAVTEDDARRFYDTWSNAEIGSLIDAALGVCTESAVEAFGIRLRRDPELMAVMAYCGPRGIPRSTFLSWSDDDQDAALAWAELDRAVCKRCGTEHADWDPERGGDPEAFLPMRITDQGCYLLDAAQANLADDAKDSPDLMFGARFVLVRREQHPDFEPDDDLGDEDVALIGGRR